MNDHQYLIPIKDGNPHGLGRHVNHDVRNFEPQHLALINPPAKSAVPFPTWYRGAFMTDQGDSPSCTIHAFTGLARTTPNSKNFALKDRALLGDETKLRAAYEESKDFDPWPGREYDGTSSDASYQWARNKGIISSWKWLKGEDEVREWLKWFGPCSFGTLWLDNMFTPKSNFFLDVSGAEAGGHEYEIAYYSQRRDAYRVVNSWGYGWGDNGRAWLAATDARGLLDRDGDAVTIG